MKAQLGTGRLALLAMALLLLATSSAPILAQDSDPAPAAATAYGLSWHSVDGGGVMHSTGGSYTLSGTAGQADARAMAGGPYRLVGGFWAGLGVALMYGIYLPLVVR